MKRVKFDKIFPMHEGADYVKGPMIAADHLSFLMGKRIDEMCRSGDLLSEGLLKAQKLYQSDFVVIFSDVSVEVEAMGVELEYFRDNNPHPLRLLMPEEVESQKIWEKGRLPELFKAAEICRSELGDEFTLFFSMKDTFSLTAMTIGTEDFLIMLIDDPQRAEELLDKVCKTQMGLLVEIISNGYIPFIGSPIASGGMIGEKSFIKYAAECIDRLFGKAHELHSAAALHICGTVHELIEPLVNIKPDIISFEDSRLAPMMNRLSETIPMGFIPTSLFMGNNSGAVEEAVRYCKDSMDTPYILSTGCDVPSKSNPEFVKLLK